MFTLVCSLHACVYMCEHMHCSMPGMSEDNIVVLSYLGIELSLLGLYGEYLYLLSSPADPRSNTF